MLRLSFSTLSLVEKWSYFRCNLPEVEGARKIQKPTGADSEMVQLCWQETYNWKTMKGHLTSYHDLVLEKDRDFCDNCEKIFTSTAEAVAHWLTHAMLFATLNCTNDKGRFPCTQCKTHFQAMSDALDHFKSEIKLNDCMSNNQANLLSLMEESEEVELEDVVDADGSIGLKDLEEASLSTI